MAVNIVVYSNNIANAASAAYWSELEAALRLDSTIANSDKTIYLNENGEYSGVSAQEIASLINGGDIWIDWCGWPLYWNNVSATTGFFGLGNAGAPQQNPANFGYLMQYFGFPMGYGGQSYPSFSAVPQGWNYLRSLVVTGKPQNPSFIVNSAAPSTVSGNDYVYSSFAVKNGSGAYIYAVGLAHPLMTDPFAFFSNVIDFGQTPNSITPSQYIPFVKSIIGGLIASGVTKSNAPQCSNLGTYAGNAGLASGFNYYVSTQNGVTGKFVADASCAVRSQNFTSSQYSSLSQTALANIFANGPTQYNGGGTSTSTARGKCTGFGVYMGPGNDFGSYAGYDVYKQTTATGYVYNVIDPVGCKREGSFPHSTQIASAPSPATGGTSTKPSTGVPPVSTTTWLLAGGVGIAGLAWLFWPRKGS